MNCLSSFIYYMVRLCHLAPSFCTRDTALDVSTTTWKGTHALDAAWTARQTSSQWFITVNKGAGGNCNHPSMVDNISMHKKACPRHFFRSSKLRVAIPNGCTLRFCAVVWLSIRPVGDVGSITKTYQDLDGNAIR